MKKYTGTGRCGNELVYYLNEEKGTIMLSNNLDCVTGYMLGCRNCPWVNRQKNNMDELTIMDYYERKTQTEGEQTKAIE